MDKDKMTRRQLMGAASAGTLATIASGALPSNAASTRSGGKLALQGGAPVRTKPWPAWPIWDRAAEESILSILRSGKWYRGNGKTVSRFEEQYARLLGAKRCVTTVNGTNALLTALLFEAGIERPAALGSGLFERCVRLCPLPPSFAGRGL